MSEIESRRSVVVADIKMPFWSMLVFMVKWTVAAIPEAERKGNMRKVQQPHKN